VRNVRSEEAAGHGSEAAMAIFEDLVNPYWTAKESIGDNPDE